MKERTFAGERCKGHAGALRGSDAGSRYLARGQPRPGDHRPAAVVAMRRCIPQRGAGHRALRENDLPLSEWSECAETIALVRLSLDRDGRGKEAGCPCGRRLIALWRRHSVRIDRKWDVETTPCGPQLGKGWGCRVGLQSRWEHGGWRRNAAVAVMGVGWSTPSGNDPFDGQTHLVFFRTSKYIS